MQLTRRHEVPELLWNNDAFFGLVVLQDGTHHARGGAHGGVQHVHELRLKDTRGEGGALGVAADGTKHPIEVTGRIFGEALTLSIIFLVCP